MASCPTFSAGVALMGTSISSAEKRAADPLEKGPAAPDRVVYALGVLLDAQDFKDEQLYHRGRLARALAYLHGHGTVAGLAVRWDKPLLPGDDPQFPQGREEEIVLKPGLAIDR